MLRAVRIKQSHNKASLMRCLGCTLARVDSPQFVTHLSMFRQTQHALTPDKWKHTKKGISGGGSTGAASSSSSGILSYIRDYSFGRSVDAEVLNLRATFVLSYGYVVFYCPPEGLVLRLQQTVLPFLRQYTANAKENIGTDHCQRSALGDAQLDRDVCSPDSHRDYKFEPHTYLNEENSPEQLNSWIRLLGAKAAASLVLLQQLDARCAFGFPHFASLRQGVCSLQRTDHIYVTGQNRVDNASSGVGFNGIASGKIDDDEASTVMEATIMQCRKAIGNLVQRRPCVEPTLVKLLKIVHPSLHTSSSFPLVFAAGLARRTMMSANLLAVRSISSASSQKQPPEPDFLSYSDLIKKRGEDVEKIMELKTYTMFAQMELKSSQMNSQLRWDLTKILMSVTLLILATVWKAIDELKKENAVFRDQIKSENASFRDQIKSENASFRDQIKSENASFRAEICSAVNALSAEIKSRKFGFLH